MDDDELPESDELLVLDEVLVLDESLVLDELELESLEEGDELPGALLSLPA